MQSFASQSQSTQSRNVTATATARLAASKTNWASAGGSNLPTQTRDASGSLGMDSYARATDGQPTSTRQFLDTDFPTLSGPGNQPQSSQFASNAWSKPPVSSEQTQQQRQRLPSDQNHRGSQRQTDNEDIFLSTNTNTQSSRGRQAQTMHTSVGLEPSRRSSLFQNDAYQSSGFGSRMAPPGMENQSDSEARDPSRLTSPSAMSQGLVSTRSPVPPGMNSTIGQDRTNSGAPGPASLGQRTIRPSDFSRPSPQSSHGLPGHSSQNPFTARNESGTPSTTDQSEQNLEQALAAMSPQDRWGFAGLVAIHQGTDAFRRALLIGQDLNDLGLDLNSPEPLLKTWTGPFDSPDAAPPRPLNDDYTIPACYNVQNVLPINNRVSSFTDETLFFMFYTSPQDILQEIVAEELLGRKWRFHIPEKMWMCRDERSPPPIAIEKDVTESGTYWWWEPKRWAKVRKQYILRYSDLDDHLQQPGNFTMAAGPMGAHNGFGGPNAAVPDLERLAGGMNLNGRPF